MRPEQFEKLVHRLHEKAFYAKDGLTGSYGDEYDAVLAAHRAAWENRVPEAVSFMLITGDAQDIALTKESDGWGMDVFDHAKENAIYSTKAATPAPALEAWRKEDEE